MDVSRSGRGVLDLNEHQSPCDKSSVGNGSPDVRIPAEVKKKVSLESSVHGARCHPQLGNSATIRSPACSMRKSSWMVSRWPVQVAE